MNPETKAIVASNLTAAYYAANGRTIPTQADVLDTFENFVKHISDDTDLEKKSPDKETGF